MVVHSAHDHYMMEHGGQMGVNKCSMNMVFTWGFSDLCIIFRWWHVKSTLSLIISLVAIVAICAGYEALREGIRRYEAMVAKKFDTAPHNRSASSSPRYSEESDTETAHFVALVTGLNKVQAARRARITKAVLYGIQNFYAFMIMLMFMTYNGWVMMAVSLGAGLGYLAFGENTPVTKETACH